MIYYIHLDWKISVWKRKRCGDCMRELDTIFFSYKEFELIERREWESEWARIWNSFQNHCFLCNFSAHNVSFNENPMYTDGWQEKYIRSKYPVFLLPCKTYYIRRTVAFAAMDICTRHTRTCSVVRLCVSMYMRNE